jgi:hypothetical protein
VVYNVKQVTIVEIYFCLNGHSLHYRTHASNVIHSHRQGTAVALTPLSNRTRRGWTSCHLTADELRLDFEENTKVKVTTLHGDDGLMFRLPAHLLEDMCIIAEDAHENGLSILHGYRVFDFPNVAAPISPKE